MTIKELLERNKGLMNHIWRAVDYFREQNYYRALFYSGQVLANLMEVIEAALEHQAYFNQETSMVDPKFMNEMLGRLLDAQERKDYVLLADLYELELLPFHQMLQGKIMETEPFVIDYARYEQNLACIQRHNPVLFEVLKNSGDPADLAACGYEAEYTASGFMTMARYDEAEKYYLHGNGIVYRDARAVAKAWLDIEQEAYVVYGLGLGYHIMELQELAGELPIRILESDIRVIQMACAFSDMESLLKEDLVSLHWDPDYRLLNEALDRGAAKQKIVLYQPSLRGIEEKEIREKCEEYFVLYSSIENQKQHLKNNFVRNTAGEVKEASELKVKFAGKDVYLIAAGPSLDRNIGLLKERNENAVVLATGTVFQRLQKEGIRPDYVIVLDATPMVAKQFDQVQAECPLLYLSTAYYRIPQQYQGEKYILCQHGYVRAEQYAAEHGYPLYHSGGSVATIALDFAIAMGCRRVIFVGLDLAHTGGAYHAKGVLNTSAAEVRAELMVEDIYGGKVPTGKNLNIYRKWIEDRIREEKNIEFIDATEGGAKIAGTCIMTLAEAMKH